MQLLRRITDQDVLGEPPELLRTASRIAARGILLDESSNVAMMYLPVSSLYKLPGGGVEANESFDDAFLREVREETGYNAVIVHRLGYIEEHKYKNRFLQVSYCFIARANERNETKLTAHEKRLGLTMAWMPFGQAAEAMEAVLKNRLDYSAKFMLLRDKTILDAAGNWLRLSERRADELDR